MAFVKLRKKAPNINRPYKVSNYKMVGFWAVLLSGCLAVMYMLPKTGCTFTKNEFLIVIVWMLLGLVLAIGAKIKYKDKFGR